MTRQTKERMRNMRADFVTGPALLAQIEKDGIQPEIATVAELAAFASKFPYYKYDTHYPHR